MLLHASPEWDERGRRLWTYIACTTNYSTMAGTATTMTTAMTNNSTIYMYTQLKVHIKVTILINYITMLSLSYHNLPIPYRHELSKLHLFICSVGWSGNSLSEGIGLIGIELNHLCTSDFSWHIHLLIGGDRRGRGGGREGQLVPGSQ